jgi:threonine dehydrogenase-like Zn-dependent dehydrogenase
VALAWEKTAVLPVDWIAREIKLQASFGSLPEDWRIALDLMRSGKVSVGPMLSEDSFILLEDIQQAFESLVKPSTRLQTAVKL